jgi:hypothetical protein
VLQQFVRQTDGTRRVVSLHAEFDAEVNLVHVESPFVPDLRLKSWLVVVAELKRSIVRQILVDALI